MVETVLYRAGQFLRALAAQVPEEQIEQALQTLKPEAQALFRHQAAQDQLHALAVYHALRRAGHKNPHLLAAALLHDSGKAAARLPAWQRAIIVILDRFAPRLLAHVGHRHAGDGSLQNWRLPFAVYVQHPEIGARRAQEAGCSDITVALIRRHQEKPTREPDLTSEEDRLLTILQAADGVN
jgi:hypothetical protein